MDAIDLASANRAGGPIPGAEVLADTAGFTNPYMGHASNFAFVVRLLADGTLVVSAVLLADPSFALTARRPLAAIGISYKKVLRAFAKKRGLGAKVRFVEGTATLVVGNYAEKTFSSVLASFPMERTNAAEAALILGAVCLHRSNAILRKIATEQAQSLFAGLGGGGAGAASVAGLLATLRRR